MRPILTNIIFQKKLMQYPCSENDENNSSCDRLNDNFNDDNPEINLDYFAVTSQYHYVTFGDLELLSHDNDDAE